MSQLTVRSYNIEMALQDIKNAYAVSPENAAREFFGTLKGADDAVSKEEMFDRLYLVSSRIASYNSNILLSIIYNSKVLKQIYNSYSIIQPETIDGVTGAGNEFAYTLYFINESLLDLSKKHNENISLSNELFLPSSLTSILLRVLYEEHLANIINFKKHIAKKESFTQESFREEEESGLEAINLAFSEALLKIKKNVFNEEYVGVVVEIKDFFKSFEGSRLSEIRSLSTDIKQLKEALDLSGVSNRLSSQDFIESEIDEETFVYPDGKGGLLSSSDDISTILEGIKQHLLEISPSSEILALRQSVDEVRDAVDMLKSTSMQEGSSLSKSVDSSNQDSSNESAQDKIIKKIAEIEFSIVSEIGEIKEKIVSSKLESNTFSDEENDSTNTHDAQDEIKQMLSVLLERTESGFSSNDDENEFEDEIANKLGEILGILKNSSEENKKEANDSSDDNVPHRDGLSEFEAKVNSFASTIDKVIEQTISVEEKINTIEIAIADTSAKVDSLAQTNLKIIQMLESLQQDISNEITIAEGYRNGTK